MIVLIRKETSLFFMTARMCDDFASSGGASASGDENISSCVSLLYDTDVFRGIAAIRSTVSVFSFLCCLTVIFLIICYRKYHFFPQRLILYLAVVSAFHSCVLSASRVNYHSMRPLKDPYCMASGFLELYSSWVEVLLIACIITHLLLLLILGMESSRMEVVHLIVSFILPFLWCWIPLIGHAFGTTGPWCGVRVHTEQRECRMYTLGTILRFILWQIPIFSLFLIFFLTCIMVIVCKLKKDALEWDGSHYDPEAQKAKQKMIRQVKALLCYPIVFLLLKLPLLFSQLYETTHPCEPQAVLWLLDALTSPLGGAVVALVYVCDANTRTKLRACCSNRKEGGRGWSWRDCLANRAAASDPVHYSIEGDTMFGDSLEGELARSRFKHRASCPEAFSTWTNTVDLAPIPTRTNTADSAPRTRTNAADPADPPTITIGVRNPSFDHLSILSQDSQVVDN